jgi:hypothetical protein
VKNFLHNHRPSLIVSVITVSLLIYYLASERSAISEPTLDARTHSNTTDTLVVGSEDAKNTTAISPSPSTESPLPQPEKKSLNQFQHSSERLAWMKEAYILDTESAYFYHQKSIEELSQLAAQQDVYAQEILGLKQAYDGDQAAAVQTLQDAVVNGSIGAALALANLYTGSVTSTFEPDKFAAFAWFNVARAMGEVGSAMLAGSSTNHMTPEEAVLAQLYFASVLAEIQQRSNDLHGHQLPFHPEPVELNNEERPDK